ncbi:transferase, partial [Ilyonectria sp. MPI-CAGE-AT-0026]
PFVLGPFDQLGHFATPINAVWIYESPSLDLVPLERLRKAISRLLDYYPHLTGRICIDASTDVRSVNRLGTGIHLVEACCDASFQSFASDSSESGRDFSIFDFPGYGNVLLAPWDLSLEGVQRDPVFTIQRTEFACSAVAIGMRLSHVVGDAGSFLGLYQDLAEIYRAMDDPEAGRGPIKLTTPPHLPPFMVDQMLHMDMDEKNKALNERPATYSLRGQQLAAPTPAKCEGKSQRELSEDPFVGRSLRFSPSALATLKRQAIDPDDSSSRASTFTALTAHLWQHIHLARLAHAKNLSNEETSVYSKSMYGTSVDFTPHFGLPKRSFGNTVVTPIVELDSRKLAQAKLWEIAKIINDLVRHVSLDETRKLGSWIAAQPKKSDIQLKFKVTPTTLITTGWHHFPLYSGTELDIPPVFAAPISMESLFDGMVLFVEPKAKDGGIEAIASMAASTWELLDADEEF